MSETRACRICGQDKPLAAFYVRESTRGTLRHHTECRGCYNATRKGHERRKHKPRNGLCEGRGFVGGPVVRRECAVCKESKASTAYWNGSDTCTACRNRTKVLCAKCGKRQAEKQRAGQMCSTCRKGHGLISQYSQDIRDRVSFDSWMESIGATAEDYQVVSRAVQRYGLKGPTADDVIEEYVRDASPRQRRHGELFHATVLLATEEQMMSTRERRAAVPAEAA